MPGGEALYLPPDAKGAASKAFTSFLIATTLPIYS